MRNAVTLSKQYGARIVEGYPRPEAEMDDPPPWTLPYALFAKQDFQHEETLGPYYCRVLKTLS